MSWRFDVQDEKVSIINLLRSAPVPTGVNYQEAAKFATIIQALLQKAEAAEVAQQDGAQAQNQGGQNKSEKNTEEQKKKAGAYS